MRRSSAEFDMMEEEEEECPGAKGNSLKHTCLFALVTPVKNNFPTVTE